MKLASHPPAGTAQSRCVDHYFTTISLIVLSCALLAWLTIILRQPVIVAYFVAGIGLGPLLLSLQESFLSAFVDISSRLGVTLLLFLAGMVLHPDRILKFLRTSLLMMAASALLTWLLVFGLLYLWGLPPLQSHICGLATMFSSTILVVKLLPTTTLHQRRMGSLCIAILIAEDILAVVLLTLLQAGHAATSGLGAALLLPAKALLVALASFFGERYLLRPMMRRADRYPEVLVILCLAWGLSWAAVSETVGLSAEIGAFIAGVALARCKIAYVLAEQLKPLRDFFLMFFFFTLGLRLDLTHVGTAWLPALLVALLIVVIRPVYGYFLLRLAGEEKGFARETALRLGQASEFGLIVAAVATQTGYLAPHMSSLIQIAIILSMVVSSYFVSTHLPTPIGPRPDLQLD